MSLTFSNAVMIAQMELNKIQHFGDSYVLLEERATETPFGWLIPWAQNDFRTTKEVRLGGNLPFFVDRFTGEVCHASVIHEHFEDWLRAYAKQHGYVEGSQGAAPSSAPPSQLPSSPKTRSADSQQTSSPGGCG
jgi:hypothetical protein